MNVLLVTMEMQVGGAETHIFELAKELKNRGNNVWVMSAGGKYAEELENVGVQHIYAPLKNKKPNNMFASYKKIKNIIELKKIDVVHAHARIPAFISALVCKKINVPLVTTVHGIYKVTPLLKILTNWGTKTLAVSDDIKKQVMDVYKIANDNISVTVNGINVETFSKGENDMVKKELGIDDKKLRIVHVSRLDKMSSNVAEMLISISDELNTRIKSGVQLIVVGDGDRREELEILATNKKNVIITGVRTDVSEILKNANLFVGVSRAALEAMSCELPVILAGNKDYGQGYIGLFDETKVEQAINTNFCCRNCSDVNSQKLLEDIIEITDMDREKIKAIAEYGRKVVEDNYSIKRMVDDAEKMYKEVSK